MRLFTNSGFLRNQTMIIKIVRATIMRKPAADQKVKLSLLAATPSGVVDQIKTTLQYAKIIGTALPLATATKKINSLNNQPAQKIIENA